jgi:hypothetical protein
MKNKKLNFAQFSKKTTALSKKHQKAVKGGAKQTASFISPITSKWIEVDIRRPNPDGSGNLGGIRPSASTKRG